MQKRTKNGKWALVGGANELSETIKETAIRKCQEEMNITTKNLKLFDVFTGKEFEYTYLNGDWVFFQIAVYISQGCENEVLDYMLCNIKNLAHLLNGPDKLILKKHGKTLG